MSRRVLALDISTHAGYALLEDDGEGTEPRLIQSGNVVAQKTVTEMLDIVGYPWAYLVVARQMATDFLSLAKDTKPDVIVVEETNLGKNRYSQKTLEFLHCYTLDLLYRYVDEFKVVYISSAFWRQNLGVTLSKEDKKNNTKLAKAKRNARQFGRKPDLKKLGIRGKTNKKHVAIRHVNAKFNLQLKVKDNDIADAICLGEAYLNGAPLCDGSMSNRSKEDE